MQSGRQRHLRRCDRSGATICRLEHSRIDDDRVLGRGSLGTETNLEFIVTGKRSCKTCHGRRHTLVARDNGLDRPLLGRQDLVEHGLVTVTHQPPIVGCPRVSGTDDDEIRNTGNRTELAVRHTWRAGWPTREQDRLKSRAAIQRRNFGCIRHIDKGSDRQQAGAEVKIVEQGSRSQVANRKQAIFRLHVMIEEAAQPGPPRRRATRPSRSARARRISDKRARSRTKRARRRPGADD